jgi:metallo-beta-lactamase class B
MQKFWLQISACVVGALVLGASANIGRAQGAPDHPTITVEGHSYTPASILSRNMGTREDQEMQFPPHKVIGNVYYVGTKTLSSFLVVTPAGNILIDSTYERNVRTIQKSVEQLGFKFSDIKILLGNHAHGDHMEGDALVKELTGAQVIVMDEDVPALRNLKPGGKEHPIDKIIHDGDTVTLGGLTLTAHLTPGHTRGATAWTMQTTEDGRAYNAVFFASVRSPAVLTPPIVEEFKRSFKVVNALPCDVPLGDHPAQFSMLEKYPKIKKGSPNPYIDKPGCKLEAKIEEGMFNAILEEQKKAGK